MKSLIYNILRLILLAFLGGCIQSCSEELQDVCDVQVRFIANIPTEVITRSYGDAGQINTLVVGVFSDNVEIYRRAFYISGNSADVLLSLAKNQTYDFVFWAYDSRQKIYDISDLTAIRMNKMPEAITFAMAESMDAFYATENDMMITGDKICYVDLVRPLSQINVGTSKSVVKASFTAKGVPDTFHPFTGSVSGKTDYTWDLSETTNEVFTVDGTEYGYLTLSYLFAPDTAMQIEAELTLKNEGVSRTLKIPHVEIEANKRSNIVGRI